MSSKIETQSDTAPEGCLREDDPAVDMMYAARTGNIDFLSKTKNLLLLDERGDHVVRHSISAGNMTSLRFLAEERPGIFHVLLHMHGPDGIYPLLEAVFSEREDMALYLLNHGARILLSTRAHGTPYPPLHQVICMDSPSSSRLFLKILLNDLCIPQKYDDQEREYILSARTTVDLYDKSDPPKQTHSYPMITPYDFAMEYGNHEAAQLLLQFEQHFTSSMHIGAKWTRQSTGSLNARGASSGSPPMQLDAQGNTLLTYAVVNAHWMDSLMAQGPVFEILLHMHAPGGMYPLLNAIAKRNLDVARKLLQHGARLLLPGNAEGTPLSILHCAVTQGGLQLLLQDLADGTKYDSEEQTYIIAFRDDGGRTARELAVSHGRMDEAMLLQEAERSLSLSHSLLPVYP